MTEMTPERIRREYRGPTMLEIASAWESDHKRAEKAEAHIRTLEFVVNKDGEIAEEREARIEALEMTLRDARQHIEASGPEEYAEGCKRRSVLDEIDAALAKED